MPRSSVGKNTSTNTMPNAVNTQLKVTIDPPKSTRQTSPGDSSRRPGRSVRALGCTSSLPLGVSTLLSTRRAAGSLLIFLLTDIRGYEFGRPQVSFRDGTATTLWRDGDSQDRPIHPWFRGLAKVSGPRLSRQPVPDSAHDHPRPRDRSPGPPHVRPRGPHPLLLRRPGLHRRAPARRARPRPPARRPLD